MLTVATELAPAVDRFLIEILVEHDIDFIVAPVSAKAQVRLIVTMMMLMISSHTLSIILL